MESLKNKVGIFTLPLHNNYGGVLQAFALYTFLTNKGYNVTLINHYIEYSKYKLIKTYIRRFLNKYLFNKNDLVFLEKDHKITDLHIKSFILKYLPKQTINYSNKNYHRFNLNDFDTVIVGSDQVWRKQYVRNDLSRYFLDFVSSPTKKIAFAASFGLVDWQFSKDETQQMKILLNKFSSIAVREDSAVDLLHNYLYLDSSHVIDPTMLLAPSAYNKIIEQNNLIDKKLDGDIFTYILDNDIAKEKYIFEIEKSKKAKAFTVLNKKYGNYKYKSSERIMPPIEQWLYGISKAKYVVTDSFHGCVFAILYNKPFLVFANENRGLTRFSCLLKIFSLENRIVKDLENINVDILYQDIDWNRINDIINNERVKASNFLLNSLNQ